MRKWLSRWFGESSETGSGKPETVTPKLRQKPEATNGANANARRSLRQLQDHEIEFLSLLNEPPKLQALDSLSPDDRTFVAGIQRHLRNRELELPVVPEMALRLSRMFRDGVAVGEFVKLIESDASLSVEVLKTANSAFYAAAGREITSLQDAIVRIGLERLQSVLMVAHLRGKVLKAGVFQSEAELLLELAPPIGQLASKVATGHATARDICFMRGALLHVEHLVIAGTTAAVARDVKRTIVPSPQALHHAFIRSGVQIREALAAKWNLRELLLGGEGETSVADEYGLIRRVLISRWLRLPIPEEAAGLNGLDTEIEDVAPRVATRPEDESGRDPSVSLASQALRS